MRSGVNWMRLVSSPSAALNERTSSVFATPGTPSSSTWPRGEQGDEQAGHGAVLADDGLADLDADAVHRSRSAASSAGSGRGRRRSSGVPFRSDGRVHGVLEVAEAVASSATRSASLCGDVVDEDAAHGGAVPSRDGGCGIRDLARGRRGARGRARAPMRPSAGMRSWSARVDGVAGAGVQARAALGRLGRRAPTPAAAPRRAGRTGGHARRRRPSPRRAAARSPGSPRAA